MFIVIYDRAGKRGVDLNRVGLQFAMQSASKHFASVDK